MLLTEDGASLRAEVSAVCAAGVHEVRVGGAREGPGLTRPPQGLHEEIH